MKKRRKFYSLSLLHPARDEKKCSVVGLSPVLYTTVK